MERSDAADGRRGRIARGEVAQRPSRRRSGPGTRESPRTEASPRWEGRGDVERSGSLEWAPRDASSGRGAFVHPGGGSRRWERERSPAPSGVWILSWERRGSSRVFGCQRCFVASGRSGFVTVTVLSDRSNRGAWERSRVLPVPTRGTLPDIGPDATPRPGLNGLGLDQPIRETGPHLAAALDADLTGDGPLYQQLADALKRAIDRGEVPLGTVLPPERALAKALAVSRATVVSAYERLKVEGWLESRQGSGTWVRTPELEPGGGDAVATARLFLSDDGNEQRSGPGEHPFEAEADIVDLTVAALPATPLVNRVLASLTVEDLEPLTAHHGYLPQGLRALRDLVADRFAEDGLPTRSDQVVITTGAHQAISLVARQLLRPGDTVLVESPTFAGALDVFRRFGARSVPLPVDDDGVRTDVLHDVVDRTDPRLIYLAPHFHNPTGAILPVERRRDVAELAASRRIPVLEDLAMADVVLDEQLELPRSIAAHHDDAPAYTLGSTAKLYWAGLRIGWVRSPEAAASRTLAVKTVADLGSPLVSQLLAMRLIELRDEVQRERRAELRPRRDHLAALLRTSLPDWDFDIPAGGLSLWVHLPHGNAEEFADLAARHGVLVVPGPSLSVDEGNRRALRVVFCQPERDLEEGVRRLAAAWERYGPSTGRAASSRLLI
ncbi:PLP-dependent aminotransferase family protein [Nitriliruptoraceae bacterium ZYF776]|nr:PLP-dependent aminotransferase family protein [Profundirhabdus halotolerans]